MNTILTDENLEALSHYRQERAHALTMCQTLCEVKKLVICVFIRKNFVSLRRQLNTTTL
jgi:hypothetical protein